MTIDDYMSNIEDDNLIVSVGSASSYFFIGTRAEWFKLINKLSRSYLKRLKGKRDIAEKNVAKYKARLAEQPIKLIFGKNEEQTISYLRYAIFDNERTLRHYNKLIDAFKPFHKRKVIETYDRIDKADGVCVKVEGIDYGDFWTRDEFEAVYSLGVC